MRLLASLLVLVPAASVAATVASGSVTPAYGTTNHPFKFYVTFTDNAPPLEVRVNIDGVTYRMATTDTTPADGAKYSYTTRLPIVAGCSHAYFFEVTTADGTMLRYPATGVKKGAKVGPAVSGIAVASTNPLDGVVLPSVTTYLKATISPSSSCDGYSARLRWLKDGWTSWKTKTMSQSSSAQSYDTYRATLYSGYDRTSWDIDPGDSFQYFFEVLQYDGTLKRFAVPAATPLRLNVGEGGVYDGISFDGAQKQAALACAGSCSFRQLRALPLDARIRAYDGRPWGDLNLYSDACGVSSTAMSSLKSLAASWIPGSGTPDSLNGILADRDAYNGEVVTLEDLWVFQRPAAGAYELVVSEYVPGGNGLTSIPVKVKTAGGTAVPAEIVQAFQHAYDTSGRVWVRATVVVTATWNREVVLQGLAPTTCWPGSWGHEVVAACTAEICGDGVDQDCDGADLACAPIEITSAAGQSVALGQKFVCTAAASSFSIHATGTPNQNGRAEAVGDAGDNVQDFRFGADGVVTGSIAAAGLDETRVTLSYRAPASGASDQITVLFDRQQSYCDCLEAGGTSSSCP